MYFEKRLPLILQLGFRQDGLEALRKYIDLLWASNEDLNLFSRKMTYEELIDNHVIDCLLPLKNFPSVHVAADFGSGGGLPGVLYAIQFPDTTYKLFEKSPKKQMFLKKCQGFAKNLQIQGEIPKDLEGVEIVSARAFKPIDVILELSSNYYKNGGRYFLLKGRQEKIEEELQLSKKRFKDLKSQSICLESPLMDVERHLVLINP